MNISIFSKMQSKGGNEWRQAEYIIGLIQRGHNVNIYCNRKFNGIIKQYIIQKIGTEWLKKLQTFTLPENNIQCRENEVILFSPIDKPSFGKLEYMRTMFSNIENISKLIIVVNWARSTLDVLTSVVGSEKTVFACANNIYKNIFKKKGCNSVYIPSPISEDFLETTPDYDNLIIGRHSRSAGCKFSPVYEEVIKNNPNWDFSIMGIDGENHRKLSKYENVSLLREFQMSSISYLSQIGIFLQINALKYKEMSPRVVAEAMMAGLPVIAENRNGSVSQIINGETGILIDQQEGPELVQKQIYKIMKDRDYRKYLGSNAKKYATDNFSSKKVINKIEELMI